MLLNACQTTKETKVNEEPIEVIKKELKTNIDLGLTDNNYTVSYDKEIFGEIDTSATDNSLFIKCLIDKEHMHENYIDVQYEDKYSADKLFDGLVL